MTSAPPRRTLVLGGARSGKSGHAESLLAAEASVRYVATGYPPGDDPAWSARVAAHRARRPGDWATVETLDLVRELAGPGPLLIDCLALWLTRIADSHGGWQPGPRPAALDAALDALVAGWLGCPGPVVAVSAEVGLGVVPATAAGGWFRDELGLLNQRLAAASDAVWLVVAGLPLRVR